MGVIALGHQEINCAAQELAQLNPPSGTTCGTYLYTYISNSGGYIMNPDATSACLYCPFRTTDNFLGTTLNMFYVHRWRNVKIFALYLVFNVSIVITALANLSDVLLQLAVLFTTTYLFHVLNTRPGFSFIAGIKKRLNPQGSHDLPGIHRDI